MKNTLLIVMIMLLPLAGSCQSNKVLVERNGKVGIGTTQPDEMLTVKGKIHTREVIVDLKGAVAPDYVFESYYEGKSRFAPDYKFPSLQEIEAFVRENHHLPGIDPAQTLEDEGMELKAMNLKLLEKIEELTLFTIAQQKQIDALTARLENKDN